MKRPTHTLLTYSLVFFFCLPLQGQNRSIHYLKIIDTDNPELKIRESINIIADGIRKEIEMMADNLLIPETDIHEYDASGDKFDWGELLYILDNELFYAQNDIVVVAYVGPAQKNTMSGNTLPTMNIGRKNQNIDFGFIYERILETKPNNFLSFIIADNDLIQPKRRGGFSYVETEDKYGRSIEQSYNKRKSSRYKDLFPDAPYNCNTVLLQSADLNYNTVLDDEGCFFWREFIYQFEAALTGFDPARWEDICEKIEKKTKGLAGSEFEQPQQPRCETSVGIHPTDIIIPRDSLNPPPPPKGLTCRERLKRLKINQRGFTERTRIKHRSILIEMKRVRKTRTEIRTQKRLNREEINALRDRQKRAFRDAKESCK